MPTLRWLTRDEDVRAAEKVPYRLLEEDPALGYGDRDTGNMLIQGDNLEALKSLLPFYAGQVKCIYIDPPYNTGSAFEHYDDNLEHSKWLAMMWPRLELLRDLLAEDGSIWVTIDDNEGHYLRVILDEIFGRKCFVAEITWRNSDNSNNNVTKFSQDHNTIQVFSKRAEWRPNFLNDPSKRSHFKNRDNDPRGAWFDGNPVNNPALRPTLQFDLKTPSGKTIAHPPNGWRWSQATIDAKLATGELRFSDDETRLIRRTYLCDMAGLPPSTLWTELEDTSHNRAAKYELKNLFPEIAVTSLFTTPKPENLLRKVIELATNPGDLVMDSFLGSGTTAAVAQKMGRRFIGIEMGDHAVTHCQPRQVKVTNGEQGGISKAQEWQGGGGFRFYRLGSTVFDDMGQLQPDIRFPTLAAHIWFSEFNHPWTPPSAVSPFLGAHKGQGLALLYNGILGDKSVNGGNVLTRKTLAIIRDAADGFDGPLTIYGERTVLADASLDAEGIVFKQTPYDVRARK